VGLGDAMIWKSVQAVMPDLSTPVVMTHFFLAKDLFHLESRELGLRNSGTLEER
jgi:hypothetical protein